MSEPSKGDRGLTLDEIARAIGGTVSGEGDFVVTALRHPLEASHVDDLVILLDPGLVPRLPESPVRVAVLGEGDGWEPPPGSLDGWIRVDKPRFALAALIDLFTPPFHAPPGVHPSAVVEEGAELGEGVSIGALAHVGPSAVVGPGTRVLPQAAVGAGARIGRDCLLHPGARIGERVVLGDRVIVHHNACIGADGFSFVTPEDASFDAAKRGGGEVVTRETRDLRRIGSMGTVEIGNDVEIGALTAIDRANIGATRIGEGTKIDNHCQIGHNVQVGRWCLFSGMVGVSGSVRVGDRVVLAARVGVADHIRIGDDAVIGAGSGVWRDVEARQVVMGYPALPKPDAFAREINVARLPRLLRDVAALKKRVRELAARLEGE